MRVGFVCIQDASDVTSWSGIPYNLLQRLRAQGMDVELFSPLSRRSKAALTPVRLWTKARKQTASLDHFPLVLRSYAAQIRAFLRKHPVDVIFSPGTIPITLLKCPQPIFVWTDAVFHSMIDYYDGSFSNMTSGAIQRGRWQEETALRNSTRVFYSSHWALSAAQKLTDPSKLAVLPFGSSMPAPPSRDEIRSLRESRLGKDGLELLFVGVDWARKGGAIAVETARLLNLAGIRTTLRIAGARPEGSFPEFVEFLGFINKNTSDGLRKLNDLFRGADFFILPTQAEAAGIVFAEASSFGLPILTYTTGGATDYVRNGVNGYCLPPGAPPSEFAKAIARIHADPAEYLQLSTGASLEYETRLNWDASVKKLIAAFSEALQRS